MSGFRNGFIKLDSPREVFYSGQVVLGSVVFEIEQPFSLAELFVDFIGEAKVFWTEVESEKYNGIKRYKDVEYKGREEYFNQRQLLAGGSAPVNLPPGTHTYQFSYQLPLGIPSSFSGERGDVTYTVRATLDLRGQACLKQELTKQLEVVAPFDLNMGSPRLKEPVEFEFEEIVGCGCFNTDPVIVRVRLPVSGYCPGQVIPVELAIDNRSNVEIRKIIFQILTREKYRTQRPISEYVPPARVLATCDKGAVLSGVQRNFTVDVTLPDLIAPNLERCGIIDVGYFFKAIVKLSGCNNRFEDEAEICLGLVPLNETLTGEYVHPFSQSLPIGPIPDIPPETRETASEQQSSYDQPPNQYPNPLGFQIPGFPLPPSFTNANANSNVQGSYFVQVSEQRYSSSDPSKNYNVGFTMSSMSPNVAHFSHSNKDLRIHLPQPNVNVNVPSAPPPSS